MTRQITAPEFTAAHLLLGPDYRRARESGLLDMFHAGAVQHILAGEVKESGHGLPMAGGYHHEPSGGAWTVACGNGEQPTGVVVPDSGVHPANRDPSRPYMAAVMIGGLLRTSLRRQGPERTTQAVPALNSMFPYGLSAVEVLETVAAAFRNRDTKTERLEGGTVVATGTVPGTAHARRMRVRVIWDLLSEKIITGAPLVPAPQIAAARTNYVHVLARGTNTRRPRAISLRHRPIDAPGARWYTSQ